jgi:hypothetical protein
VALHTLAIIVTMIGGVWRLIPSKKSGGCLVAMIHSATNAKGQVGFILNVVLATIIEMLKR